MWCKTCNIETNEDLCPVCGSATIEDIPTEVYWCAHCETPVIQAATQADKGFCPLCKRKMKYLSADLRPVFPEERLLLELLLGEKPFTYVEKSVWAANSRYYINGKSVSIPSKTFQEADTDALSKMLEQNKGQNTYEYFDKHIASFINTNKLRLHYLKDEAYTFIKKAAEKYDEEHIVLSFSGGKDSTVTADIVIKTLGNPSLVHIFGDTTLEFPSTIEYATRYMFFQDCLNELLRTKELCLLSCLQRVHLHCRNSSQVMTTKDKICSFENTRLPTAHSWQNSFTKPFTA